MDQLDVIELAIQKVGYKDINKVRVRKLEDGSHLVHFLVRVGEVEEEDK